jgi:hypothetical protein
LHFRAQARHGIPTISSTDGTKLYDEEAGAGTPVVFVHEFAGDLPLY